MKIYKGYITRFGSGSFVIVEIEVERETNLYYFIGDYTEAFDYRVRLNKNRSDISLSIEDAISKFIVRTRQDIATLQERIDNFTLAISDAETMPL